MARCDKVRGAEHESASAAAGKRVNKPEAPGQQHLVGGRLKKKQVPLYPLRCGAVGGREREAVCVCWSGVARGIAHLGLRHVEQRACASFLEPLSMLWCLSLPRRPLAKSLV